MKRQSELSIIMVVQIAYFQKLNAVVYPYRQGDFLVLRLMRKYTITILVILVLMISWIVWNNSRTFSDTAMADVPLHDNVDQRSVLEENVNSMLEPSVYKYYETNIVNGAKDSTGVKLMIPSIKYAATSSEGTRVNSNLGDLPGEVLTLLEVDSWVEYVVDIPQDGNYMMGMTYYALPGKRSSIVRNVQIDGVYPFFQAKKLEFQRMWHEVGEPTYDNQGNEYNPKREEVLGWQYRDFRDSEGRVSEPFRFFMKKGLHTIRINAIREAAAIGEFIVYSPTILPTYAVLKKQYEANGYKTISNQLIKVQAEKSSLRSDPTLKRIEDREPLTEPFNKNAVMLNVFGGVGWRNGGQWAEWKLDVPESGLYNIGARFGQWFLNGIPVQRSIMIDGKIPFQEMNETAFPFKQEWQIKQLGNSEEDYLFYLEKGQHTLRMEVQVGALGSVLENIIDSTHKISLLNREVIRVTGTNPDPNGDWNLEQNIPNLIPRLQLLARLYDDAINELYAFGVLKGSSEVSTLYEARDYMLSMAEDTSTIPARLQQMTDLQASLGLWVNGLSKQSLVLDYIIVKSPDKNWPVPAAPWYVRTLTSFYDTAHSFTKHYGGIGDVYEGDEVINVWVARGRDWVQIIKQMIDEDFTSETGIKVNVNVVPAQQMQVLLLASTAGLAPDVALGVEGEVPIDYAIRGGLVDLNQFPDYQEIAERFRPGALIPYKFNGGDYALPENQNFNMLFYRKDIMAQLGITENQIPETWQEVMDLIPLLQQNGMDFIIHTHHLIQSAPLMNSLHSCSNTTVNFTRIMACDQIWIHRKL